jgi:plastocyanin
MSISVGVRIIAATLVIAGAAGGTAEVRAAAPAPRVQIQEFKFAPAALTVGVGTTVTWVNGDEEPHTVTSKGGLFASPGLDHDEVFSRTFTTPGTFQYFCALHPRMTGAVIVK